MRAVTINCDFSLPILKLTKVANSEKNVIFTNCMFTKKVTLTKGKFAMRLAVLGTLDVVYA